MKVNIPKIYCGDSCDEQMQLVSEGRDWGWLITYTCPDCHKKVWMEADIGWMKVAEVRG